MNQMQVNTQMQMAHCCALCLYSARTIFPCPDRFHEFQEFQRQGESEDYKIKKKVSLRDENLGKTPKKKQFDLGGKQQRFSCVEI